MCSVNIFHCDVGRKGCWKLSVMGYVWMIRISLLLQYILLHSLFLSLIETCSSFGVLTSNAVQINALSTRYQSQKKILLWDRMCVYHCHFFAIGVEANIPSEKGACFSTVGRSHFCLVEFLQQLLCRWVLPNKHVYQLIQPYPVRDCREQWEWITLSGFWHGSSFFGAWLVINPLKCS